MRWRGVSAHQLDGGGATEKAMHHAATGHGHGALQLKPQKVAIERQRIVNIAHDNSEVDGVFGYLCLRHSGHHSAPGSRVVT